MISESDCEVVRSTAEASLVLTSTRSVPTALDSDVLPETEERHRSWIEMLGVSEHIEPHLLDDLQAVTMSHGRRQELDKACALLSEAVGIAGRAELRPCLQRIVAVRQRLTLRSASPETRQLDERLRALL
jgi:hypothetical protein